MKNIDILHTRQQLMTASRKCFASPLYESQGYTFDNSNLFPVELPTKIHIYACNYI